MPHTKDHGEEFRRRQNKTLYRGSYFDAIAWPERGFQRKGLESFPQVCAEFKRAGYRYEGSEPDLRLGPKD
jgi:hypothetical protein